MVLVLIVPAFCVIAKQADLHFPLHLTIPQIGVKCECASAPFVLPI
jgi:hypothetical protein